MGAVAEFERDLIRERVRAGMQAAKKRGRKIGRPRASVPLSKAQALLDQGTSVSAAARELGVSRATLQRAMARSDIVKSCGSGFDRGRRSSAISSPMLRALTKRALDPLRT
jgi:DNA invertase Pin-like site-specific DNA recombinase